jgi:pyruvate kinase
MAGTSAARVKIAATIGPASEDPQVLRGMIEEGAAAIRVNASHIAPSDVAGRVRAIRRASKAAGREVAIMLDLQGIKRRVGALPEPMQLESGESVVLSSRSGRGRIPVKVSSIGKYMRQGTDIFMKDGHIRLRVTSLRNGDVHCKVVSGGLLTSRAGLNLPGVPVAARVPTKRDLEHVAAGVEAGVDLLALSFVRSARDLTRCERHANGIPIVAKIERPEAVAAIEEIAATATGLLVARGDLAVEMRPEELPLLQKKLIAASNRARKPVIVATEMLASMVRNTRPTRAELTDVGNAVLDGADATLLSDETAVGRDPVHAVRYMARILGAVNGGLGTKPVEPRRRRGESATRSDWAIADAAVETAYKVGASAIVAVTGSGRTARLISAGRPSVPLLSFSPDPAVRRRVALMWGVDARNVRRIDNADRLIAQLVKQLCREGQLKKGDRLVVAFGSPLWGKGTKTNTVRVAVA